MITNEQILRIGFFAISIVAVAAIVIRIIVPVSIERNISLTLFFG